MTLMEGPADTYVYTNTDTFLTVRNGQPFSVTVRTTPYTTHERSSPTSASTHRTRGR